MERNLDAFLSSIQQKLDHLARVERFSSPASDVGRISKARPVARLPRREWRIDSRRPRPG
ncbi:hypothetical protein MPC1_1160001 [Methylocella tundrae]|nr:hypothetical protein MPC1_1160001 [Methylocella tundrae]